MQVYQDVTGCQATLLSAQTRVVELESQVSPIASPGGHKSKKKVVLGGAQITPWEERSCICSKWHRDGRGEGRNLPVRGCLQLPGGALGTPYPGQHQDLLPWVPLRSGCWSWSGRSTKCCWRVSSSGTRRTWISSREHTGTGLSPTAVPCVVTLSIALSSFPAVGGLGCFPNLSRGGQAQSHISFGQVGTHR